MEQIVPDEHFDPKIHLNYVAPTKKYTFQDLGLARQTTATEIAASSPFSFLSTEGVKAYRKAIASPELLKHCAYRPFKNTLVLRNVVKYSTFIRELWTHPETLKIIRGIAGVTLVPALSYEIGQTNIQADYTSIGEITASLAIEPSTTTRELTEEERSIDPLKQSSIIPWHYDSYPYVLVVMLSNTVGMHGGETYLRKGDGSALKVEGPSLGHGVFLQGGEVQHLAARAMGVDERIATITSMRADVPGLLDSSYLTNVRPVSHRPTLYREWLQNRVHKMKVELDNFQAGLQDLSSDVPVDITEVQDFFERQIGYLRRTASQVVPYELHEKTIREFGQDAYYAADECWDKIQKHPHFERLRETYEDKDFLPQSHVWGDFTLSKKAIENGLTLRGQLGEFKWDKTRPYMLGDELLRLGLRELFFEWLKVTGFSSLIDSSP